MYKENFLKLLKIAERNGWEIPNEIKIIINETENDCFVVGNTFIQTEPKIKRFGWEFCYRSTQYSINDIVIDWSENKISFSEALAKASQDFEITSCAKFPVSVRQSWVLNPIDKRLDWLLETFKHLCQ